MNKRENWTPIIREIKLIAAIFRDYDLSKERNPLETKGSRIIFTLSRTGDEGVKNHIHSFSHGPIVWTPTLERGPIVWTPTLERKFEQHFFKLVTLEVTKVGPSAGGFPETFGNMGKPGDKTKGSSIILALIIKPVGALR